MFVKIFERNYRSPIGEIDIIAKDGKVFVFVEVKTRSRLSSFHPLDSITGKKLKKLEAMARYFQATRKTAVDIRFDAVAITLSENEPHIEHFKNVFISGC